MTMGARISEAVLIMPAQRNDGSDLTGLLSALQSEIADVFGGVTITAAAGSWKNGDTLKTEPVFNFMIAAEDNEINNARLVTMALAYGAEAGQESVYLRAFDGTVRFLYPEALPAEQAA